MNWDMIIGYIATAIGAGGLTQLANWKFNKKKNAAEIKADEIENMRKAMEDFYKPLVDQQNKRIHQLEGEVSTLRDQLTTERTEHQRQIDSLQRQIIELYRVLGVKTNKQVKEEKSVKTPKPKK